MICVIIAPLPELSAQKEQHPGMYVSKNTSFHINGNTQVVTSGDVELLSPVTGQGQLKINGKQDSKLDAHGNSIANLLVTKSEGAGLSVVSGLHITRQFTLQSGTLVVYDDDITMDETARLLISPSSNIKYMGMGRILHPSFRPLKAVVSVLPVQVAVLPDEINVTASDTKITFIFKNKKFIHYKDKPPTPPA